MVVNLDHLTLYTSFILVWTLSDSYSKKLPLKQVSLKNFKKRRYKIDLSPPRFFVFETKLYIANPFQLQSW